MESGLSKSFNGVRMRYTTRCIRVFLGRGVGGVDIGNYVVKITRSVEGKEAIDRFIYVLPCSSHCFQESSSLFGVAAYECFEGMNF